MSGDIRERVFSGCVQFNLEGQIDVESGAILENLLLFETFILNSTRLKEIPTFIQMFGYDGLRELLKSGALKIYADALTVEQVGQTSLESRPNGLLPLGSYSFTTVQQSNDKDYIHRCFSDLEALGNIRGKPWIKLKSVLAENLVKHPNTVHKEIINLLKDDIERNDPSIKVSLSHTIQNELGESVLPHDLYIRPIQLNDTDFKIETNLNKLINFEISEEHKLVERAVLAIGGRDQSIINMKNFNALTSFRADEVNLLELKLNFLLEQVSTREHIETFRKIITIRNFPDFQSATYEQKVNIDKFLKIRQSKELKEFRSWLWTVHNSSEQEILEYLDQFNHKVSWLVQNPTSKFIRWIAGTVVGLIPGIGSLVSCGYSLADTFLLDKILSTQGPIVFLDKKLPSIYKR